MIHRVSFACALGALTLTACVGITDKATFLDNKRLYIKSAEAQVQQGKWHSARQTYFLALSNAEWAEDKPSELAKLNYEVGRVNGVTCRYDLAEKHLNQAYEFDKQSGGPTHRALVELGRLNLLQGKSIEATSYFDRAVVDLQRGDAAKRDPIGVAEVLEDFAKALEKGGDASRARTLIAQANELRAKNANKTAASAPTPYGTQCSEPKG